MSTQVLIKVSPCVWICKVAGLRSNHRLVFFVFHCFSLRPPLYHQPVRNAVCLQTRASCRGGGESVFVLCCFLALEFTSNKARAAAVFSSRMDIWR